MASKQLGKLRQWAGEVISSRDKTTVSEEFRELEKDIELRREGATKLLAASEAYQYALSKKKKNEAFEDAEKLLPIDTLGIVMIAHGEEFGDDSAFGTSLVKLGRAHCKVATLQEAYALTFNDTFLSSVEKFTNDIKEYDSQRKKLDSRRLSYDAAVAKYEKLKGGKKEKEKKEAEEEMERARERYEETSEDVQAHMHAIQENEVVQLRELTSFLDLEINFVEQYLNVLKEVKSDWYDHSTLRPAPIPRVNGSAHVFPRPNSVQSKRSVRRGGSDSSDDERVSRSGVLSRRSSTHKRSDSNASKPPSRPTSRASKKRSDSIGTLGDKDDKEKDKSRRLSVAGWASSAVGSVTGRSKKGKDKFSSLNDDEKELEDEDDDEERSTPQKKTSSFQSMSRKLTRDKSKESLQSSSPKLPARIQKPLSLQDKKVVRALYNFTGSVDELSFNVGDEIVVINEVIDGWWMGELGGKKGLFPTTHVEAVAVGPALPKRPPSSRSQGAPSSFSSEDAPMKGLTDDDSSYLTSDLDDDHDLIQQPPLSASHGPFYSGPPDAMSITSSLAEDDDDHALVPPSRSLPSSIRGRGDGDSYFPSNSPGQTSPRMRNSQTLESLNASPSFVRRSTPAETTPPTPGKKAPPPPPPRRSTTNVLPTPPIPVRPYKTSSTQSSGSLKAPTPASSISSHSYDRSPFESATELSTTASTTGCGNFKQNPFQAKGMCNNCFQFHE